MLLNGPVLQLRALCHSYEFSYAELRLLCDFATCQKSLATSTARSGVVLDSFVPQYCQRLGSVGPLGPDTRGSEKNGGPAEESQQIIVQLPLFTPLTLGSKHKQPPS